MNIEELKLIIAEGESLLVEFKERYSSKINRDIVAFSNTKGGYILIGVNDSGEITGAKLSNELKADINVLARNCEPPITIKKVSQVENVIVVEISEGSEKPYSCSSGYFRRLDATTQKMNRKELELMFQKILAISFEEKINRSVSWEDISEEKIKAFFKEADINLRKIETREIMRSLNLSKGKNIKNAGVLFFAKNPQRFILQSQMTLVAFKGTDRINIYDRMDIKNDLLTQFNEAMIFLQRHLNVRSEIKGINRKDICELPIEVLREAVTNAITHRDYSIGGTSLMVEVHEDRVVISNPGRLPEGLSPRSLINVSIRRNELIADMFARMDKAERMGTGIKRMWDLMRNAGLSIPTIKSDIFFTITFSRPEYSLKADKDKTRVETRGETRVETREKILQLIGENKYITMKELAKEIGITEKGIEWQISQLKKEGVLKHMGPTKRGHWEITKKNV